MSTILAARDFKRGPGCDFWAILVEDAINNKLLPVGIDPDDVDSITVKCIEAHENEKDEDANS